MISAYVTNLGMYNEGSLVGEYLRLPASPEDVQALMGRIGIDGKLYEEIFITDYETNVAGLYDALGEYENLDELNYLASLLDEMDDGELEKFEAAVEYGDYTNSVKDLINLAQNLDCFQLYDEVHDEEDLGRYYVEECNALEVPESIAQYFDYEAYGRDMALNESGAFTDRGYIISGQDTFVEHYDGRDIPDEYRIMGRPAPERAASIMETMKQFQSAIDRAVPTMDGPDRPRPRAAHDDR